MQSQEMHRQAKHFQIDKTPYSTKPEIWEVKTKKYLVIPGYLVSSSLKSYGYQNNITYVITRNENIYTFDWAPTIRIVSKSKLLLEHNYIKNNET